MSKTAANKPAPTPAADAPAPPRVALHAGADGVAIVMPLERAGGVQAFGALKPGVVYVVSPAEAARLTAESRGARRFDVVSPAASAATEPKE